MSNRTPESYGYKPDEVEYFTTDEGTQTWLPAGSAVPEEYSPSDRETFESEIAQEDEAVSDVEASLEVQAEADIEQRIADVKTLFFLSGLLTSSSDRRAAERLFGLPVNSLED